MRRLTGDYPAAAWDLEEALGIYRDLGDHPGQTMALNNLGLIRRGTGDFAAAARDLEEALNISRAPVTVSTSPTPLLIWGCAAPDREPRRRVS